MDKDDRGSQYEIRPIRPEEGDQAVLIEHACFPPHEACTERRIKERIKAAPELFLVAVDRELGKPVGMLNGIATDEGVFRDEFFTDASLHDPRGKRVMILSLAVLPEYQRQGIARELMAQYALRARQQGRSGMILTCLQDKVELYGKMGFEDLGIANSSWGGEEWHEMRYRL